MNFSKQWILVIGAGPLQTPAIIKAKERTFSVMTVDMNPHAIGFKYADLHSVISIYDKDKIIEWSRSAVPSNSISGVITMGTDCSCTVAEVARAFGLPGVSPESAFISVNKDCFREKLKEAGIFTPDFLITEDIHSIPKKLFSMTFPLVVKPVDSMGSRGVKKIFSHTEFSSAVVEATGFSRRKKVIIEEFLEGNEFSLDACMIDGKCYPLGFADRVIEYEPFFVETGYSMPSVLGAEERKSMISLMEKASQAIGVYDGIVKGDLKLTEEGPVLIEMAVRLSGNRMSSDAIPISCGVDAVGISLDIALGKKKIPPNPEYEKGYAYRAFLPASGVVKKICGIEKARAMKGVVDLVLYIKEGDEKKPFTCSADSVGYVIAKGETREIAEQRAQKVIETVYFDIG